MGFLSKLGDAEQWLKDSPVGQVVDAAMTPVNRDDPMWKNVIKAFAYTNPLAAPLVLGPQLIHHPVGTVGDIFKADNSAYGGLSRAVVTPNLVADQVLNQGDFSAPFDSAQWKKAWKDSQDVSIGQALTVTGGGT